MGRAERAASVRRTREAATLFILLMVSLALGEVASFFAGSYLSSKGVFYVPPSSLRSEVYLAERDPLLGWPSPTTFGQDGKRDSSGARIDPVASGGSPPCISLYGDSFTWSEEVGDEDAWGSLLGERLGCRVANYGIGGYGTDQSFLRYRASVADEAPVVIMGHSSENIIRNVSSSFDFVYPGDGTGFKPRFEVDPSGELSLLPLPRFTPESHRLAVAEPEVAFPEDFFVPGGGAGTLRLKFPYTLSVVRAFRHFRVRAELTRRAAHEGFYQPDHPTNSLAVTTAVLAAFADLAQDRGQTPVVVVLPNGSDFASRSRSGEWPYQPLLDSLDARGLRILDGGDGMLAELGGADPCTFFTSCSAHYNARGYEAVARMVEAYLEGVPRL